MKKQSLKKTLEPIFQQRNWDCFEDAEGNYTLEVPLPGGRKQKVSIRVRDDAYQNPQMQLLSFVCRASQCDPKVLLEKNIELSYGALGIERELVYMVDTLLIESADPEEIISSIRHMAEIADDLEKELTGHDIV